MKKENTSIRLKKLMSERNLKQIDILSLTKPYCNKYDVKMNKSDISQYVSGKIEPSQNKLVILSMALGVSEAWLMGYDVPMSRRGDKIDYSELEKSIITAFRSSDDLTKAMVLRALNLDQSLTEAAAGANDKLA